MCRARMDDTGRTLVNNLYFTLATGRRKGYNRTMKGKDMSKVAMRLAALGMRQKDLAQAAGANETYISRVLNGRQKCSDRVADAIAAKLGRTRRTLGL